MTTSTTPQLTPQQHAVVDLEQCAVWLDNRWGIDSAVVK